MHSKFYRFLFYSIFTVAGLYLALKLVGVILFSSFFLIEKTSFFKVVGIIGLAAIVLGVSFVVALSKVVEAGGSLTSLEPIKGKGLKVLLWIIGILLFLYISICLWIWWVYGLT